jgi:hypothetical protein
MDQLIDKIENNPEPFKKIKFRYATASDYFDAVQKS